MKLLLVEDDVQMAEFIVRGLKEHGHTVDHVEDGRNGLFLAASESYDVAIIDRMLPSMDGINIVKTLRSTDNHLPVLFLTTMANVNDRVAGLNAGGDDYLVKPFSFSELLARLSALGRRPPVSKVETKLERGELEMDLLKREVRRAGKAVDLLPQEFKLLEFLIRSDGGVVTRTMLLEKVWDFHFDPQTTVVETHMSRLRSKLDKGFDYDMIKTLRGVGYRLVANP